MLRIAETDGPAGAARRLVDGLDAAALRLARLEGWPRRGAALAAGVAAALAFAPFYALALMAAGFSALVLLLDGAAEDPRPRRAAFAAGWFFGFGYHLVGLYWLAFSFFVQAEEFAWMAPIAVAAMPAFLGLFSGTAAALAVSFRRAGWRRILVFAAAWMILEYARGHVLTGLPWNLPGQALAGTAAGAQSAALYGVYGLSLVALVVAGAPAAFLGAPARSRGAAAKGIAVSVALTGLLFAAGFARLAFPGPGDHDDAFVRIVQPNIPQREKIDPDLWGRNFRLHTELSKGEAPGRLFILWPENAAPLLAEAPAALDILSQELPVNAALLAGSVRREEGADGRWRYYNSLAVVAQTPVGRRAVAYYDKHHLVPFGEYLPFETLLRAVGLAQLAPYDEGFAAGVGPRTLNAGGPSFSPLICYEAIFPGALHPKGERPEWLVAVTNDAWFGDTSGPRQHLDQARLRAIESGLPMARAANTGASALIDARGRYVARLPLYEQGVIDAPLPRALPPTPYARFGDLPFALMLALAAAIGLAGGARRPR
ncbi:apolipoprotein N-acyltransferase [Amphiplicatus metriothermophilus]|uniref:Apolipoprotein N-acyltransferase n=1 Tax=Amphiplicatus metriothermophilus TaxID=1519374 RepID=A0A239PLB1_9PROT|nr:apolipoprotein N-acyltransferase [Amphiplicatus metriothermophilus]MBB5517546.1 apolipoprotein N-acyltransferase [Amphiplicatus metriothermophilus]SNT68119.1 Apolipoprotein N-acyltransferase [Amphiplicatus metriothermophilus]